MNPCEDCLYYRICMERRGICTEYKTLSEVRKEIEMLNKEARTSASPTDSYEDGAQQSDIRIRKEHL